MVVLLAETTTRLNQLAPASRARLFGSLLLLAIGGLAFMLICWALLRTGRRHIRRADSGEFKSSRRPRDDWATRPLRSQIEESDHGPDTRPEDPSGRPDDRPL